MKNITNQWSSSVAASVLLLFFLGNHIIAFGQTDLNGDNDWHQLDYNGGYQDFRIPNNFSGTLFLRLWGADGGYARPQLSGCQAGGGSGAFVNQRLPVGNGPNEIPPGSTIRFIIGQSGQSHTTNGGVTSGSRSGAGGGGTAVAAKINGQWTVLSVAGGGGGAYARVTAGNCEVQSIGRSGNIRSNGDGSWGNGTGAAAGGTDGGGGGTTNDPDTENDEVGGGGGAFHNGDGSAQFIGYFSGGHAGWANGPNSGEPTGGAGGDQFYDSNKNGGFGFGGGGAANHAGGGGGGYSGGGSGDESTGGGGGGSYVHPNLTNFHQISAPGNTFEGKNGVVRYKLGCGVQINDVTVEEPHSCDGQGARVTVTVNNLPSCAEDAVYHLYDVQDKDNPLFKKESGTGIFTDVAVGQYAVVLNNPSFGNMGLYEFEVNLSADLTPPTPRCKDITVSLDGTGTYILRPEEVDDGSTDNCGIKDYSFIEGDFPFDYTGVSQKVLSCEQVGDDNFGVGLIVTDLGNTGAYCFARVTVLDATPVIPDNATATVYLNADGRNNLKVEDLKFTANYPCSPRDDAFTYQWELAPARYDCADIGREVITPISAVSPNGVVSAPGPVTVTVLDTIRPAISCQDVTIELNSKGEATIDYTAFIATAGDNCLTEAEIISGYRWDTSLLPGTVNCDDIGTYEVNLLRGTVAHETNLPPCTATLTIVDKIAPAITCQDITVALDDQGLANIPEEDLPIIYSDNCTAGPDITIDRVDYTFTCANIDDDNLNVAVIAMDGSGNSSSCTFHVTVQDNLSTRVRCKDRRMEMDRSGPSLIITPNDVLDGVGSACIPMQLGTAAFAPGTQTTYTCEDIGEENIVTLIFTPDNGDPASSCTARITPYEQNPPRVNCPGIDIGGTRRMQVEEDPGLCGAVVTFDLNPVDNCGIASVVQEAGLPSGTVYPFGETLNAFTVTDVSGNTNNCTFIVEVRNNLIPDIICSDITVDLEPGSCEYEPDTWPAPSIENACSITTVTQTGGPTTGTALTAGRHVLNYRVSNLDKSAYCSITVTVNDKEAPVARCKDATVVLSGNSITLSPDDVDDGSFDACSAIDNRRSLDRSTFYCFDLGENQVTLMVNDEHWNRSSCVATVTILPEDPVCKEHTVLLDDTGNGSLLPEDVLDSSYHCDIQNGQLDRTAFSCDDLGEQPVLLTLTVAGYRVDCTTTITVNDPNNTCPTGSSGVDVSLKVMLGGPYDADTGLMSDQLRTLNLIPTHSPYAGTTDKVTASILSVTGNNAIVDWVRVELRSPQDENEVLYTRAALLQRDGDVVDVDGVSPVSFPDAVPGDYYVCVSHRNHLGVMTATAMSLGSDGSGN